jgi:formylglycine-generating enzyme required for sulfatase activity
MSGNVWEWEDACDANGNPDDDPCSGGAGSFWDSAPGDLLCETQAVYHKRNSAAKNVGFRCCADAK